MKKVLFTALLLTLALLLVGCGGNDEPAIDIEKCYTQKLEAAEGETNFVQIEIEGGAYIVVELYPETAPITVANFKKLVKNDFYNGLTFHRVIKDFMIQGGCPRGDGKGGSGENIFGEFAANEFDNDLKHTRGVISMARGDDYDSASSQFFIMHRANSSLDGKYAAFGKVVAGMETVDAIAVVDINAKDKPLKDVKIIAMEFVDYGTAPETTK